MYQIKFTITYYTAFRVQRLRVFTIYSCARKIVNKSKQKYCKVSKIIGKEFSFRRYKKWQDTGKMLLMPQCIHIMNDKKMPKHPVGIRKKLDSPRIRLKVSIVAVWRKYFLLQKDYIFVFIFQPEIKKIFLKIILAGCNLVITLS